MCRYSIPFVLGNCNLALDDGYRYLREDKPHGSAGGLYKFRDLLMEDDPVSPLNP